MKILRCLSMLSLIVLCSCTNSSTTEKKVIATVVAKKVDLIGLHSYRGIARAAQRQELRAEKELIVKKIHVKNSQRVSKGKILVSTNEEEDQGKLIGAREDLRIAELELESTRVRVDYQRKTASRKKYLYKKEIIARKDFDRAERDKGVAESKLEQAQLEVERLKQEVEELGQRIKHSGVKSTMSGIVSNLPSVRPGGKIRAGSLVAIISEPRSMALWIEVDETQVDRVRVGGRADVVLDTFPEAKIKGRVIKIDRAPNAKTGALNFYDVAVSLHIPRKLKVREGYAGSAEFKFLERKNVVTIPINAVRYMGGKDFVVVASEGALEGETREVVVGGKTDLEVEIRKGLKAGEVVLLEESI